MLPSATSTDNPIFFHIQLPPFQPAPKWAIHEDRCTQGTVINAQITLRLYHAYIFRRKPGESRLFLFCSFAHWFFYLKIVNVQSFIWLGTAQDDTLKAQGPRKSPVPKKSKDKHEAIVAGLTSTCYWSTNLFSLSVHLILQPYELLLTQVPFLVPPPSQHTPPWSPWGQY